MWTAPGRPVLLNSLPDDLKESLCLRGSCHLDEKTVKDLMSTSSFQRIEQNRSSSFLLNDSGGVAMLCWQTKEVNVNFI